MSTETQLLKSSTNNTRHRGIVLRWLLLVSILVIATTSVSTSRSQLLKYRLNIVVDESIPPLYLPNVEKVRLVTLGFDNFFADILWFHTINYFGKQLAGSRDYRWLGQMCDLVTSLNPKVGEEYEFCATLLSWMAKDPAMSEKLLSRAIENQPDYWRYHYLRGFTKWYFLNDFAGAKQDFTRASTLPHVPPFVIALTGRLMVAEEDPEAAIKFLQDMIKNSHDETARKALGGKLFLAFTSRDVRLLTKMLTAYEERNSKKAQSLQDLLDAQLLTKLPLDPYGKPYRYNPDTGVITNSKGKKGLEFGGKTADTGLASKGL